MKKSPGPVKSFHPPVNVQSIGGGLAGINTKSAIKAAPSKYSEPKPHPSMKIGVKGFNKKA